MNFPVRIAPVVAVVRRQCLFVRMPTKMLRIIFRAVLALISGRTRKATGQAISSSLLSGQSLNQALAELFRNHQVHAEVSGEWVAFPGTNRRAAAIVVQEFKPAPHVDSVQLDVSIELEDGRFLVESFVGLGESKVLAVADSFHNFVINSFHVMLRGIFVLEDDQVNIEDWEIDGEPRTVVIGNMVMCGPTSLTHHFPVDWWLHVASKIKMMPLTSGTHWVRIYFAQMNHQILELEVLLDNNY